METYVDSFSSVEIQQASTDHFISIGDLMEKYDNEHIAVNIDLDLIAE